MTEPAIFNIEKTFYTGRFKLNFDLIRSNDSSPEAIVVSEVWVNGSWRGTEARTIGSGEEFRAFMNEISDYYSDSLFSLTDAWVSNPEYQEKINGLKPKLPSEL